MPPAISFRLRGTKSNRDAIGAVVTIKCATGGQTRTLQAGSGFLSQSSKDLFFGLGEAKSPVQASIHWPSGLVQELNDLPPDHRIWVEEGSPQFQAEPFKPLLKLRVLSIEPAGPASHEAEPIPNAVETWLLAPVLAPGFSLRDSSGQTRALAALRGKPVLLNFSTTHSPLCQGDLKTFSRMNAHWASQGLQLLVVNLDDAITADSAPSPAVGRVLFSELAPLQLSFVVLRGSEDVAAIYNILY